MTTPQQTLERAYAALSAAAFAHPSAADEIGTQCSEAAKELRALLATQAQGQDAAPAEQDTGDCGFSACITCAQARAKEQAMQLTKDEINTIWSDCQDTGNATRESIAAAVIAAHTAKVLEDVEPFMFEEYPYNSHAMGCGLEDRDITDRYEAMAYGWSAAMERAAEAIPDDLYSASTVAALKAERDALQSAGQVLADFAKTAPGRLPERVTNAITALTKGQQ